MGQYTINGSDEVTQFTNMPLKTEFELLKTPIFYFQFLSSLLKIFEFWVMETLLKNQAKQDFFGGTHEFWTMSYGN